MNDSIDFERISAHTGPEKSPGYLLWRTSTQWRALIEDALKPLGLTHPQFVMLASLGWLTRKGERVSQIEVSRIAGLDPNTTSQILRCLEAKKLIKRTRLSDERSKNPTLTSAGSLLLSQAMPTVEKEDEKFFSELSEQESIALLKIFQKLIMRKKH